jgi:hypothetical protein
MENQNRNELNAIVNVLGDVLVEIKEMRGAFDPLLFAGVGQAGQVG